MGRDVYTDLLLLQVSGTLLNFIPWYEIETCNYFCYFLWKVVKDEALEDLKRKLSIKN